MVDSNPTTPVNHFKHQWSKYNKGKTQTVTVDNKIITIYCLQESPFRYKDRDRLKVKDGERYTLPTLNQKAGIGA